MLEGGWERGVERGFRVLFFFLEISFNDINLIVFDGFIVVNFCFSVGVIFFVYC